MMLAKEQRQQKHDHTCIPQNPNDQGFQHCPDCNSVIWVEKPHQLFYPKIAGVTALTVASLVFTYLYQTDAHASMYDKYQYLKFGVSATLVIPLFWGVVTFIKNHLNINMTPKVTSISNEQHQRLKRFKTFSKISLFTAIVGFTILTLTFQVKPFTDLTMQFDLYKSHHDMESLPENQ